MISLLDGLIAVDPNPNNSGGTGEIDGLVVSIQFSLIRSLNETGPLWTYQAQVYDPNTLLPVYIQSGLINYIVNKIQKSSSITVTNAYQGRFTFQAETPTLQNFTATLTGKTN